MRTHGGQLLAAPTMEAEPRALGAPEPALDAFTRARVEEAAAEAYARGLADGAAAAQEQATAGAERVLAGLQAACGALTAEVRALRLAEVDADLELAEAIAEAILGAQPAPDAAVLLDRVRTALLALDDPDLTVHASPDAAEALSSALQGTGASIPVRPDPGLAPGDARVTGRWGRAELTRAAAWETVRAALREER